MGAFQKPKYRETAADKAVREDIERRRQEELKTQADSLSYAIGMDVARNVSSTFKDGDFDHDLFYK